MRHLLLAILILSALIGGPTSAASAQSATPPTLTELTTTETSHPWLAQARLPNGYIEQEFQMSGAAGLYSYASPPPPPGNPACMTNPFPAWPVADSAWEHLRDWVAGGAAPPASPLIKFSRVPTLVAIPPGDTNSLIARDDLGNALGGIRTPAIDAPVGTYYGASPCNPGTLGFLAGLYVPFDAARLNTLYPTHDVYVAKVTASADQAVSDGFMLEDDAQQLIQEANASTVGKLGATVSP